MPKKYTALVQIFRAIVETLAEASNPNRRYRIPPEFEDLFRETFPGSDGDPGKVEDAEIDAFIVREVTISRKAKEEIDSDSWSHLIDPRANKN